MGNCLNQDWTDLRINKIRKKAGGHAARIEIGVYDTQLDQYTNYISFNNVEYYAIIPLCFSFYNNKHLFDDRKMQFFYLGFTAGMDGGKPSHASRCRNCGQCERHCPQSLPIRKHLQEVAREMEGFYFKPVSGLVRGYYKIRKALNGREKA